MTKTNNAINLQDQGVTYYDGVGDFSGLDGITANYVLTSNGTGVAPSFQTASASGAITEVAVQAGTSPIVPTAGLITINGAVVAAGTHPIRTDGTASDTMAVQVQISQAIASTDATKIGLSNFDSSKFTVDGNGFVSINGSGIGETITGNTGGALSPTTGNWNILGAVVAAGTTPFSTSGSVSTLTANIQISQAIAATDATKIGLANFDSAAFDVDANGFVQLNGGGIAATAFTVQANTAPGTNPVVPTAAGVVTINGAAVVNHSVVLETRSRAANAYNLEIQYAAAAAATDATKSGVAHFDSASFGVDANGFVTLASGAAIKTINGDTGSITGTTVTIYANNAAQNSGSSVLFVNSGTISTLNVTDADFNTIIGNGAGNATLSGSYNCCYGYQSGNAFTTAGSNSFYGYHSGEIVTTSHFNSGFGMNSLLSLTTGIGDNVAVGYRCLVQLDSGSYNTCIGNNTGSNYTTSESSNIVLGDPGTIGESHVIRIGTQGSGPSQQNACFIQGIASVAVSNQLPVVINSATGQLGTSTGSLATWSDQSGAFNAAVANGYFITNTSTATLPPAPSEGDTIAFVVDTTNILTIQANAGQMIRVGSAISVAAGTSTNNARGDSVILVYRSTGTTWFSLTSPQGTWTTT